MSLLASQAQSPTSFFPANTRLRCGEATGLHVREAQTLRRRVHVQENAVAVDGAIHAGTSKTHATKSVCFPDSLDPGGLDSHSGHYTDAQGYPRARSLGR